MIRLKIFFKKVYNIVNIILNFASVQSLKYMIVQFKTVILSTKETFERSQQEALQGSSSLDFFREQDYISDLSIEMDDVVDFIGGRVYCNDTVYECICARLNNNDYTDNVLITFEDFKSLMEKVKDTKIKSSEEILNE